MSEPTSEQSDSTKSEVWSGGQAIIASVDGRKVERVLAAASIGATAGFHATKRFGPIPAAVGAGAGAAVGILIGWLWE